MRQENERQRPRAVVIRTDRSQEEPLTTSEVCRNNTTRHAPYCSDSFLAITVTHRARASVETIQVMHNVDEKHAIIYTTTAGQQA